MRLPLRKYGRIGVGIVAGCATFAGCSASDLVNTKFPLNSPDPAAVSTPDGAIDLYRGVIAQFQKATTGYVINKPSAVVAGAVISDELKSGQYRRGLAGDNTLNIWTAIDSRHLSETGATSDVSAGLDGPWRGLHGVRTLAMSAIPNLRKYAPQAPRDYIGHAYALWGMAEVFLANTFCSGIPLSTLDPVSGTGFTLAEGSTTVEVYEHAITLFDSALANAPDSTEVQNLAKVGKGWALLNLNRYADAAAAVHDVPTDFVYLNVYNNAALAAGVPNFAYGYGGSSGGSPLSFGPGLVPEREGINGLPFRSNSTTSIGAPTTYDLRASVRTSGIRDPNYGDSTTYYPANWTVPTPQGNKSIVMASGVEARLIEAEAALKAGSSTWLTILNDLRTDGTVTIGPRADPQTAADSAAIDTIYGPGSGAAFFPRGVVQSVGALVELPLPGLPALTDPGTPEGRVDLLFAERAYWLFLTGRRHSDLRRLVRQYNRPVDEVFPIGTYPAGPFTGYGSDVNLPAPPSERQLNKKYTGCINRDA